MEHYIRGAMNLFHKQKYHKQNVRQDTVANDLCIGCGVCAAICPDECIEMLFTETKEWHPYIDEDSCSECGQCIACCPHSSRNLHDDIEEITTSEYPEYYGIIGHECRIAHERIDANRKRSASGGAVTAILMDLITNGHIDAVIHMKRNWDYIGGIHFQSDISYSAQEIDGKRSSAYYPLCLADVLLHIKRSDRPLRYACVGVPCFINAIVRAFDYPPFNRNHLLTVALMCSHNVTGQFTDFIAQSNKIPHNRKFRVNFRDKEDIPTAYDYTNAFEFDDSVIRFDRFRTAYTTAWRRHFFAYTACFFCPDFYGVRADVSVKDAWSAPWGLNSLGTSMLVVRNRELLSLVHNMAGLSCENIPSHTVFDDQRISPLIKQKEITSRLHMNNTFAAKISGRALRHNITNGTYLHYCMAKLSKALYRRRGFTGVYLLYRVCASGEKLKQMILNNIYRALSMIKVILICLGLQKLKTRGLQ